MTIQPKDTAPRMLVIISSPKGTDKAGALLEKEKTSSQYRFNAQGTASREMISLLGLGSPEKVVTLCMMPRLQAEKMLRKLDRALRLGTADSGIAFTLPLSGGSNQVLRIINHFMPEENRRPVKEDSNMKEITHALIAVIANHGYSDDIMAAARPAGASGGTLIHSRKVADEDSAKFWEFSVQEDKEIVLIVAPNDKKKAIMQAISDKCGLHSDAKSLILSLPVDSIIGLADFAE